MMQLKYLSLILIATKEIKTNLIRGVIVALLTIPTSIYCLKIR